MLAAMGADQEDVERNEAYWREFLTHPDIGYRYARHAFRLLPSDPRCQLCASPFTGFGGGVMKIIGKRQSQANPSMCTSCENMLYKHHGGAEVTMSLLFADIRGSTALAEDMPAREFRALLDRFYSVASAAVFAHRGTVDKFVGDELVAMFVPASPSHAADAVAAARDVLTRTGHADAAGPWVPVGAGVHTGTVWFGVVGDEPHVELTVVGDAVNVAARLAATAGAGEILVSAETAQAAQLDPSLESRSLELKGKHDRTDVVSLRVG
jgi:adenylate cyclase